jgi:ABC-type Fe3+-hydroxamate transport system substrate-binding protein
MTQEVDRVTAQLAKAEEEARTISLEYRADRVKSARELSEWQRRSEQAEELERDLRRHVEELSSEAKQAEEERKERCVREQKMKENYET